MQHNIVLRPAALSDVPLLKYWDSQQHNIDADPNDDWNWEAELEKSPPWREQLIAEHQGRPIGFVQIIDPLEEETHYWGDVEPGLRAVDIWLGEADDLGKGFGTVIMHMVFERCFNDPKVTAILIDPLASNVRAQRFYEGLGFKFVERRTFGDDECLVYRLNRRDWSARN